MNKFYWYGIIAIVGISLGVTFFAPISEAYKGITALPSVGGLAVALFQLIRDNSAHQRNIELQNERQLFNLGATSHMANTVFDKHVEFCEKYLAEVHRLVVALTRKGPAESVLDHAGELYSLRINYTAWITPEIDEKLMPFEKAVRTIGANAHLVKALAGEEDSDGTRSKARKEMVGIFKSLMDIGEVEVKDEDATVVEVKNRIREILQVNELIAIREYLIHKAVSVQVATNKANQ